MYPPVVNSPKTELTELITDKQTEIPVANPSVLLQGEGIAVLGNGDAAETITYTSVEDNVLKGCVRGFEGVARAWPVGTRIARNFTAADWRAAINNIQALHEEASSESRKPITLQPGVQIVKTDKQAVFNLAGLTGKTVIDYEGQKGLFGVRNPYVIRYGENLIPPFYEWTLSPRAKVINPYKLETIATVSTDLSSIDVAAVAGKTYTFSAKVNGRITIVELDSTGVESNVYRTDDNENRVVTVTFATKTTTSRVRVYTTNTGAGTFTLENPMLNIGSTAKPFKPREDSMLALQTDLYADPVTGGNADTVFERDGQYFKSKKWSTTTPENKDNWNVLTNYTGYKSLTTSANAVSGTQLVNGLGVLMATKFDGTILKPYNSAVAADMVWVPGDYSLRISVSNADSGWGDSYTPSTGEIRAYFMGWKMYDTSTGSTTAPYNRTDGQSKGWVRRRLSDGAFVDGIGTLPTTQAPEYTPYKLVYQLVTPIVEPIVSEGQLSFIEGDNQVEVGTGIVLRERVTYVDNADGTNIFNAAANPFKNRVDKILNMFEDGRNQPAVAKLQRGSNPTYIPLLGTGYATIPYRDVHLDRSYSATYLLFDRSPVVPITGAYAANEKTLLSDLVDTVQQNTTRLSVVENKKAEKDVPAWISPSILFNGWVSMGVLGYRKIDNKVQLKARIKSGVIGQPFMALPEGYRPLVGQIRPVHSYGTSDVFASVLINADGKLIVSGGSNSEVNIYLEFTTD
ncbi:hypothetical protein [Paenibacillus peoriae]|uniref:hypothetical protein n=1 Tax=Paenibacillus peoriae TaxID=59893 RepID=UPI003557A239